MEQGQSLSDQLEERMIEFAARIIAFTTDLDKSLAGRHIAQQILRSGTAAAPNYAEARGAESRADFIHKLGIVQKELNETSVWLRILYRVNPRKDDRQVALLQENVELARIIAASIKTAKARMRSKLECAPKMTTDN
jgi:four helix bundle protein